MTTFTLFPIFRSVSFSRLLATMLLGISVSFAGNIEDIRSSLESGNLTNALALIDTASKADPDNPEIRFLEAEALHRSGQVSEAITVYKKLIGRYPEMPEAYNNLAIIYADEGDYLSAISTLKDAFRSDPGYATAFNNLMSIYDKMASDAYRKALDAPAPATQLDLARLDYNSQGGSTPDVALAANNSETESENGSAITLVAVDSASLPQSAPSVSETNAPNVAAIKESPAADNTEPSPEEDGSTATAQAAQSTQDNADNAEADVSTAVIQVEEVSVAAAQTEDVSVDSEVVVTSDPAEIVRTRVQSWASAWSDQDLDGYLSHYSGQFEPQNKSPRGRKSNEVLIRR